MLSLEIRNCWLLGPEILSRKHRFDLRGSSLRNAVLGQTWHAVFITIVIRAKFEVNHDV